MAPKREQVVLKGVWEITKSLEYSYGLKPALSGAILAFSQLPSNKREELVAEANRLTEQCAADRALARSDHAKALKAEKRNKTRRGGARAS